MSTTPSVLPYSYRIFNPGATLHYVRDLCTANRLVDALPGHVGFDLEWKPTFTKNSPENPVAVVQLANYDTILVIQVSAMSEFPAKLRQFLENPNFVKAGVAIQDDVKKLYRDWQVSTRNCVDLSLLSRCVDNARWKGPYTSPLGLARLIKTYEDRDLSKKKNITRSNWERPLTRQQIEYAANDAHAGYVLYQRLLAMASTMEKIPNLEYYSFNAIEGRLLGPSGAQWNCHNPYYDAGPRPSKYKKLSTAPKLSTSTTEVEERSPQNQG